MKWYKPRAEIKYSLGITEAELKGIEAKINKDLAETETISMYCKRVSNNGAFEGLPKLRTFILWVN